MRQSLCNSPLYTNILFFFKCVSVGLIYFLNGIFLQINRHCNSKQVTESHEQSGIQQCFPDNSLSISSFSLEIVQAKLLAQLLTFCSKVFVFCTQISEPFFCFFAYCYTSICESLLVLTYMCTCYINGVQWIVFILLSCQITIH